MAYRPLHIACGVLIVALSLTAAMSVTTTGLRGTKQVAAATAGASGPSVRSAVLEVDPASHADLGSPYFPDAESERASPVYPATALVDVLTDGPVVADGVFIPASSGSRAQLHLPRPDHRGYEELPPPPEFSTQVAIAEIAVPPPHAVLPSEPILELTTQLAMLREDLQQFGQNAHGHTAVQAEMQSLRSEVASLNEQRRLEDLQHDVARIAQRQADIETQLEQEAAVQVPDPVTLVIEPAAPAAVTIKRVEGESDRWSVQLIEAEPGEVIRRISEIGQWNLVLNSHVHGPVSLSLASVTVEEMLQAVSLALDCEVVEDGAARIVVPAAQANQRRAVSEQTVAKLLRPAYIAASDLQPLIRPMLTPGIGEVAITPDGPAGGIGPQRAQSDAILIVDYPHVVAQVEEMLSEVDLPPDQFIIEAVITAVTWNERTQQGIVPALEQQGVCSAPLRRDRGNLHSRPGRSAQFRGHASELLDAIRQFADVHVEATPTIHVLNRQLAEVEVGANIAYREQIAFGRRMQLVEEEIDFLPSRTELSVRPFLQGNNTVRLQVRPKVTHVHSDPGSGLPREEIAELLTDVTIPLDSTVVIGGLTRSTGDTHPTNGPMSRLFGRRSRSQPTTQDDRETVELIVMLTPRRVSPVDDYEYLPPQLLPAEPVGRSLESPSSELKLQLQKPTPGSASGQQARPPQPVADAPLLERLFGRRTDSRQHPAQAEVQQSHSPVGSPAAFPELESPSARPIEVAEGGSRIDTGGIQFHTPMPSEFPLSPPESAPGTIQTAEMEEFRLVPPAPADPIVLNSYQEYVVPPPPPESVAPLSSNSGPASFIPPAPAGRPRRDADRADRSALRGDRHNRERRGKEVDSRLPRASAR